MERYTRCPLTGARLETSAGLKTAAESSDAPSRGHDLKRVSAFQGLDTTKDAPSRGHDLKLEDQAAAGGPLGMPPHGGTT